mgnify:FL=1
MDQIDIKNMLDSLADFIPQATLWEQGFFESVQRQFGKYHTLSEPQIKTIQNISAKFSPEAIKERESWYVSWDEEKAEILRVCAHYYMNTGYFRDLCDEVKSDEKFVPTPKQYKSMCENKYAAKVITAHRAEPKFPVGSLVTLRHAMARSIEYLVGNVGWITPGTQRVEINVLILSTTEPIISAAVGAKRYKCMPIGGTKPFCCDEKDLKKMKRSKK